MDIILQFISESRGKQIANLLLEIIENLLVFVQSSFKYLGTVVSDDGSRPEVLSGIAQATAALTGLRPIWRDNNIFLGSKVKLMRSLVISIGH